MRRHLIRRTENMKDGRKNILAYPPAWRPGGQGFRCL